MPNTSTTGPTLDTTERTQVLRRPHRGHYDLNTIYRILDEGFVCSLGLVVDEQPFVVPTCYGRDGDRLLLHGSAASRTLRTVTREIPVCVTVTLVDSIVAARSAFNHSINYRSVMILGRAKVIKDPTQKLAALELLTHHLIPGRWDEVRGPTPKELAATSIVELPIDEASAKVRSGPPLDEDDDYDLPVWAGEIPVHTSFGPPRADPRNLSELSPPVHLVDYRRPAQD